MADEKTPEQLAAEEAAKAAEEAAKAEEEKKRKKVKFSTEQQAFINELYSNAFSEGAKKVEDNFAKQLETERQQREALAKQLEELTKKKEEKAEEKKTPELDQFKAQLAEMQGVLTGIKTERDELKKRVDSADEMNRKSKKKDKFLEATKEAKIDFFDQFEAYDLAEKQGYEWDKDADRPVVLNKETNRPKLNENGEPMSVLDFVKSFAESKKYLVKAASADGGIGESGQRRQEREAKHEGKSYADMSDEEFDAVVRKVLSQ